MDVVKTLIFFLFLGMQRIVCAQIILLSGTTIEVPADSYLVVNALKSTSGTIVNAGTVIIKGDVTNNNGGLFDSESTGTVTFTGSSAQEITGAATVHFYGALDINNSSGVSITSTTTGATQEIHGTLGFTSGKFTLNAFNLTLDGTADPTGVGATKYIVSNSTGELIRTVGATNILFPVGYSAYNPIILNNSGTSDDYGVRVVDNEPTNSSTSHMVDRSWVVTEANSGNSNLAVTTQWNSGEELTSFDRTNSVVGITTDGGTNYTWGAAGAASGSDPYTRIGSGFTGVGTFAVGDYYYGGLTIDLKVILAAAWNDGTNNMDITLNTDGLIPLTDPYSVGITVSSIPANAVDWVKVELRNSGNHATVTNTYAKFVDQDGQVIEEDGSNMKITGAAAGTYYVAIHHRNHFGVVSNSTVEIASSPSLNFTNLQATAYQNGAISTNAAMKEVETYVFGLWDGNANGDDLLRYNGTDNDRGVVLGALSNAGATSSGYADTDLNMDGITRYNGTDNDRGVIIGNLPNAGATYTQHLPE